jgi:hypothetical protein
MRCGQLSEEARGLLRQILERQGYRQLRVANIRGHGLKFLYDAAEKRRLVRDLEQELETLERVAELYTELGGRDLALTVRHRMEGIPYPASIMELAACLTISDLAERVVMESYTASSCEELSAIAHSILGYDRTATHEGEELFVSFCADPTQRPHAQQILNRWTTIALRSLGRPGTQRDRRAVALGLRTREAGEATLLFLARLQPLLDACHLDLPDLAAAGIELPARGTKR